MPGIVHYSHLNDPDSYCSRVEISEYSARGNRDRINMMIKYVVEYR